MNASRTGDLKLVMHLIETGANPNQRNMYGDNSRDIARENGHKDVDRYFRSIGIKAANPVQKFIRDTLADAPY